MTSANDPALPNLTRQLWRHEDFRSKPYRCTSGHLTIGIGRNLDVRGLSEDEGLYLVANDINDARRSARTLPFFVHLNSARQDVITNMIFNMGFTDFMEFRKTRAALARHDYDTAAKEMLDSKWARQVGDFPPRPGFPFGGRAYELAEIMRTGAWPEGMA